MTPRALRVLIAFLLAAAAGTSTADHGPVFDLPDDPVGDVIRVREPVVLPETPALDAIASSSAGLTRTWQNASHARLDDATTLRAIALARAAGVGLATRDVASIDQLKSRVSEMRQHVDLDVENVFSALALGAPRQSGALETLLDRTAAWSSTGQLTLARNLEDDVAMGSVALAGAGVTVDPRDAFDTVAIARGSSATRELADVLDPTLRTTGDLPLGRAVAAAPVFHATGSVDPLDLADGTLRSSANSNAERNVDLPEDRALLATALARRGGDVAWRDVVDLHENIHVERLVLVDLTLERSDVLAALVLGGRS